MGKLSEQIIEVNNLGRNNLAEKGIKLSEDATTYEIMQSIADVSGGGVEYKEYPLPQDEYVYYRYPPCNEERYIQLGISTIEYGTLGADGYTKAGTMNGVQDGSYYEFIIPAHKEDFIIKLSSMPTYARSTADCTEVYCGKSILLPPRSNLYGFAPTTINGLEKITFNDSIYNSNKQVYGLFWSLPCQTIKFKSITATSSAQIFLDCIFLKDVQFEEMVLTNPSEAFKNCASLEAIDCSKITPSGGVTNMFFGCSSLVILDLSSWASQSPTFTGVNGLFRYCGNLKTINLSGWDLSHLTSIYDWFDGNSSLENVILDNTTLFSASFGVRGCQNLTLESLTAIFNALPTVTTTKTLTLHANHKILQSQVDSANAKGWTVAGGKVVTEEEYYG